MFNTIKNKSSNYGTSPFLWYFYSALPRMLLTSALFVIVGLVFAVQDRFISWRLCGPCLLFVLAYSVLPHKELRFIIYVVPIFDAVAAAVIVRLLQIASSNSKKLLRTIAYLVVIGHLVVNFLISGLLLLVAHYNYAGGEAMLRLHELAASTPPPVHVHIENYAAQTGVTRFLELNSLKAWQYDKTENLDKHSPRWLNFTHILIEYGDRKYFNYRFEELDTIFAYHTIDWRDILWSVRNPWRTYRAFMDNIKELEAARPKPVTSNKWPLLFVTLKPAISIMQRRSDIVYP